MKPFLIIKCCAIYSKKRKYENLETYLFKKRKKRIKKQKPAKDKNKAKLSYTCVPVTNVLEEIMQLTGEAAQLEYQAKTAPLALLAEESRGWK